jgi:hypothetical protein
VDSLAYLGTLFCAYNVNYERMRERVPCCMRRFFDDWKRMGEAMQPCSPSKAVK